LSSAENLRLFARLHGLPSTAEHVAALFDRFEIGRWGERPARTYSRGQLQRLAL
ncbi:MAG TPA: daunorubicin/doxorubicin resistance ABC transporter ATP-binding protein DrrA, partial [Myxococcales bacterium]|nr:daunorubicin/doxorubicin resistance ABC transporter ATP-binding protein DrrA [Myxococcales bacterium]